MKTNWFLLVTFLFCQHIYAQVSKTIKRLPDTGQTSGFTSTMGEDNDFILNAPYYMDHLNGTITDTVTGLMWQKTDGGEMTIENAIHYADTLSLGGYTNWRLPTALEGYTILNLQHLNPALDTNYFTVSAADYWWTSDRQANDTNKIWSTNAGGGIGNHPRTETVSAGGQKKFHVRAVREIDTPILVQTRFNSTNNIVTDSISSLQWQNYLSMDSMTWEDALIFADTSQFMGFSDWRLPNIKELFSLADISLVNPCMSTSIFSNVLSTILWSSTTLINQPSKAWIMDAKFGITTYKDKTQRGHVVLVRNENSIAAEIPPVHVAEVEFYPNPFTNQIRVPHEMEHEWVILVNELGMRMYEGNHISEQNFDWLPEGIYVLNIPSKNISIQLKKE